MTESDDPQVAELPCLVDVLAQLRQSGRESVVSEGRLSDAQRQMHVPDAIEDWVARRISDWRASNPTVPLLVVLSGNAGDGKSDLIERLRSRADVVGDDTDIIADATHAESPSQSQAERLVSKLAAFSSQPVGPPPAPRCVLVAMNVGMVISFFATLSDEQAGRFDVLHSLLNAKLGLSRSDAVSPAHWQCEVVNLDHRNLLGREHNGIFAGMIDKLDPNLPGSLTYDAALACDSCPARASCWLRTNLNLLQLEETRAALHDLLWDVTLSAGFHLTPRNVWDFLYRITTGGLELPPDVPGGPFLSCSWMREYLSAPLDELPSELFRLAHRRLLYHLVFEAPNDGELPRGPLMTALATADPIRRGGKRTYLAESEVWATPSTDSENMSTLASAASPGVGTTDPLLEGLASSLTNLGLGDGDDAALSRNTRDFALGVSRRARIVGLPSEIGAEVTNSDAADFIELLKQYRLWLTGTGVPSAVNDFWKNLLVAGVRQIFGVEVQDKTYFRLDTLSPATRFPAFVPVDLPKKLRVKPDFVTDSGVEWLEAVSYLPRTITATIDTGGGEPWEIPVDLQLYRLLVHVNAGYAPSSVDLDAFFRLRYASERLGASGAPKEIVFKAVETEQVWRLEKEEQLDGWSTVFGPVS